MFSDGVRQKQTKPERPKGASTEDPRQEMLGVGAHRDNSKVCGEPGAHHALLLAAATLS